MRAPAILRKLHLVLGLGAGVLVALTGLSGSILAFRGEIDRALNPTLWRAEPGTGAASLDRVRFAVEAEGGPPIRMLLIPARDDVAILALLSGRDPASRREIFVDPHSAQILGSRRYGSAVVEVINRFHVELFAGRPGRIVVGLGGLASLALGVSGAFLWWRSRSAPIRSPIDWHPRAGLVALVPSTILAITGAALIFRPCLAPAIAVLTGPLPLQDVARSTGDRTLRRPSLDRARGRAIRAFPDGVVTRIYLPEGPDGTIDVRLRLPEDGNPHGNTAIQYDMYSGDEIRRHTSRGATASQRVLWYTPYPWHSGDALGPIGKAIVGASGLVPALLLGTGFALWRRRSARPRSGEPEQARS